MKRFLGKAVFKQTRDSLITVKDLDSRSLSDKFGLRDIASSRLVMWMKYDPIAEKVFERSDYISYTQVEYSNKH